MDNRFNAKDIVMIVLLLAVGGLVLLSMLGQDRRQWDVLQETLTQLKDQRESVDLYKRELSQMKRDQDALRSGVEKMTENVGKMTDGVRDLNAGVVAMVEVLKAQPAQGGGIDGLGSIDQGLPESEGGVTFSDDKSNDKTFERVAFLSKEPDYAEGDFFIDAFSTTVKSLTSYIAGDIYASRISEYVLDSLLTIDPYTLEYKPWVAKSWDVSDDGLTITYNMRKDVTFSDGHPMDAHDVVFTYEWVMNPKVNAPRTRSYFEKFEYVKAIDDHTVQIKYREPYFMALTVTGGYLQILPKHWVEQFSPEEYNKLPGLLMGSGPYKMAMDPRDWQPGSQKIELVRNDNYWGPRPALDKIIWREILDPTAQVTQLRNGEIDRYTIRSSQYRNLSTDEDLRRKNNLFEYEYVSSGYSYVGWNQLKNGRATHFADQRVRQAMTLLIDRKAIASGIYDNLSAASTGPFHPLGWQADPTIEPWPYDPERAKKLLDEAGYIDRDNNGIRESPEGEPFTFEFIYGTGSKESERTAFAIKESMAQAGVAVTPNALDWPAMQQKLKDRTFDAIMLGWGGAVDSDLYQMFHSSQTEDGGNNYYYHKSDELDKAIDIARSTVDRDEGQKRWQEVHALLYEEQPYTFMHTRKSVIYLNKRFRNVQITNRGLNNAWEYYVPAPLQLHND